MGGALLPAPASALDLWHRYTTDWQPAGTGTTAGAPPYLAVVAAVSALLFGSTKAALTLLLVCSVPLAGLTAYFASRPLVESRLLRAWAAVAYAFLPAVTGALAGGRLGTAVLAILLPLLARSAVTAFGFADRDTPGTWRAAWTYTLLLTLATAFTPVVWPLAAALGTAALLVRRAHLTTYAPRLLATLAVPVLVLAPWSLGLFARPGRLLHEAGLPYGSGSATPLGLLTANPGGPGTGGGLLLAGTLLAALAALLRADRRPAVATAWSAALAGLLLAVLLNRTGWAGPATLLYGLALIAAAVLGADGAKERVAARSFGWRQPLAALIALAAAAGPLLAAAVWTVAGADGPLRRHDPVQVPAFVAAQSDDSNRTRTLVLGGDSPATVSYTLVRGGGVGLGDAEVLADAGAQPRLTQAVSSLVSGSGADQSEQLGAFAVRYVMMPPGGPAALRQVLDGTPGLKQHHQDDGTAVWEVQRLPARVAIVPAKRGQAPIAVDAGPVEAHAKVPAGEEGRTLRLADRADPGWKATLDGHPLTPVTLDGWAQGFELPRDGGRLDLVHQDSVTRDAWHWAQGLLALVLLVMALPGRRARLDDDLPEEAAPAAGAVDGESGQGRRARRRGASADGPEPAAAQAVADPYAQIPAQQVYGEESYAYQEPYAYEPPYEAPYEPAYEAPSEAPREPGYGPGHGGQQPHPYPQPPQYPEYGGTYAQPGQQPVFPHQQQPYPYEYETQQPQQPQQYDTYGQHHPRPDGSPQP